MFALLCILLLCLLLPLLTLQLLDLGLVVFEPGTVWIFFVWTSLLHLSLTLRRSIHLRGLWVGPVTWPWCAGTSPAMPPRPYAMGPLIDGLRVVEVYDMASIFSGRVNRCLQHEVGISTGGKGKECCDTVEGKLGKLGTFTWRANTIVLSAKVQILGAKYDRFFWFRF